MTWEYPRSVQLWDIAVFNHRRPIRAWLAAVLFVAQDTWRYAREAWVEIRECYHASNRLW